MWTQLIINGFKVTLKHFEEPSEYGINGGRISKLDIRKNNKCLLNFDRGWDIKPTDKDSIAIFNKVLKQFN